REAPLPALRPRAGLLLRAAAADGGGRPAPGRPRGARTARARALELRRSPSGERDPVPNRGAHLAVHVFDGGRSVEPPPGALVEPASASVGLEHPKRRGLEPAIREIADGVFEQDPPQAGAHAL